MWDVWELSQIPTPPHKVIHADEEGWSPEDKFAFDRMILSFGGRWVQTMRNKTVPYTPDPNSKPQKPMYETMAEIFEQYDHTAAMTKFSAMLLPSLDMDAVIEDAFGDDILF